MTKRQIIDEILTINQTAKPAFLARFEDAQLGAYLSHLQVLARPRLTGDASRFGKYFIDVPRIPLDRPRWRTDTPAAQAAPVTAAENEQPAVEGAPAEAPPAEPAEVVAEPAAVAEPVEQFRAPRAVQSTDADTWAHDDEPEAPAAPAEVVAVAEPAEEVDEVEQSSEAEEVGRGMVDTEDGLDYLVDEPAMAYAAAAHAAAPRAEVEDEAQGAPGAPEAYEDAAPAAPRDSSPEYDQPAEDAEDAEPPAESSTGLTAARANGPLFVAARQQQEVEAYLY